MFVGDFQRESMMIKYVFWSKKVLPECPHQHLLLRSVPVASLQAEILIVFGDYHDDHNDDEDYEDDNDYGDDGDFEYKNDDNDEETCQPPPELTW